MSTKTKTSNFGVGKRESHDSSEFYARDLPKLVETTDTTVIAPKVDVIDKIYAKSSERMTELPSKSVALMVTSPPYHVGKEYDSDMPFGEYLASLRRVFTECYRVLQPGGRAAINIANLGRKPYIALTTHLDNMCKGIGFMPRAQIVWVKGDGANGSCAWGSFQSAANPVIRDINEFILVYSKGKYGRPKGKSTITKEDFMRDTLSVWKFPPESAKRVNHPAPFPIELPRRLINLYSYEDDLVLDPYMGSGTTAIAALKTGRHFIGYDTSAGYVQEAEERIRKEGYGGSNPVSAGPGKAS